MSGANHSGVMVALFPSAELAEQIAVPGGEAADVLHVTMAFLGDAVDRDDWAGLADIVGFVCAHHGPLTGFIGGEGQFHPGPHSEGRFPQVALIDVPGLEVLREDIVAALDEAGYPVSHLHGYTPHMTLRYAEEGEPLPATDHLALSFNSVTVCIADERDSIPLAGEVMEVTATKRTTENFEIGESVIAVGEEKGIGQVMGFDDGNVIVSWPNGEVETRKPFWLDGTLKETTSEKIPSELTTADPLAAQMYSLGLLDI